MTRVLQAMLRSRRTMVLVLLALALAAFLAKPVVFVGGGSDDQRYLDAARAWIAHAPTVGRLHWDLRHPLVLPLAAATTVFGEGGLGLLLVPLGYALALMALGLVVIRRWFGAPVAMLWGLLFATNPLIHELATRIYPDLAEAFFVLASLAACTVADGAQGWRRTGWLLTAGVAASLAMLTRETSFFLPLLYASCVVAGAPLVRRDWFVVAAGAVPLLALETVWLWLATGDPLYRLHVALHHVDVPSNHMAGKVFTGSVLFNPALASRWIVSGPIDIHWTVNPIIYFLLDPFYGGAFVLAIVLALIVGRHITLPLAQRAFWRRSVGIAILAFVFVTYVLMVSQRPRYYVLPVLAAMLAGAILAVRAWPARRRTVTALVAIQVAASLVIVGVRHVEGRGLPAPERRAATQ